jgi:hypothetical protein
MRVRTLCLGALACLLVPGSAIPAAGTDATTGGRGAGLRGYIADREYEAGPNAEGLQAPNRAHDLRTYFDPAGIRVVGRSADGAPELLSLRLAGVGRGLRSRAVAPGTLRVEGARVELHRPGLVEWYVNSRDGLEHGFDLAERLPGQAPLRLELRLLRARAALTGRRISIETDAGRRLFYGKLAVFDARGAALPAHFEVPEPQRVSIVVDDRRARYPITIDPLLTSSADAQLEADQAGAALGTSVAGAGDVNGDGYADVLVGAPDYDAGQTDEGAAFVFLGGPLGVADGSPASAAATLQSDQAGAQLGASVATADVDADGFADVLTGAPAYDAPLADEGAAFLFLGGPLGIASGSPTSADATLEGDLAGAAFGASVAAAGDVDGDSFADLIVGAPGYDAGQLDEGAAFVFSGSFTGVASSGASGAAATLQSDQAGAAMGWSVAGAGDVDGDGFADVIVGARHYLPGLGWGEGAAFVFLGSATGVASGGPAGANAEIRSNEEFVGIGASVAGAGDVNGDGYADVVLGAPEYDLAAPGSGAAYVHLGGPSGIASGGSAAAAFELAGDQGGGALGASVAGAGDVDGDGYADVIVGASAQDALELDEGVAFVFLGGGQGIASSGPLGAGTQLKSDSAGAWLGLSVGGAGDVDGDGYADVIVGAPAYDAGSVEEGAAFVFRGGPNGVGSGGPAAAATFLQGDQAGAWLGFSVAGAGDVNADGYADVIVGASDYDSGSRDEGAAFVFLGGPGGIPDGGPGSASATLQGDQDDAFLGWSVAGAGDVDADGYADVIVGAPFYDRGESDEGLAFVFLGSASGIPSGNGLTAASHLEGDQALAFFGTSVAGAGDVNGDGFADVIVGASDYDAGEIDEGAAFVFLGSAGGVASAGAAGAATRLEADQPMAWLGASVAGAGDVDGDGFADVIVGAYEYDAGHADEGAAFVFLGSAGGIASAGAAAAATRIEADQATAFLGWSVAGAGDVDGDGFADVVVGATNYDAVDVDEGAAFVFLGGPGGVAGGGPDAAAARLESNQASAFLGSSVSGAGDVDGDGFADVIVGASDYDAGEIDEGAAFVFLGNSGRTGRPVNSAQRRGDATPNRVTPWGVAHALDAFRVQIQATDPAGRGRVQAEVEACPPQLPFGDAACVLQRTPTWVDVSPTPGGVMVEETLSGLTPNTLYRWRARVLRAPFGVTEVGVTPPPNPAHGPWRRLAGQAREADIRTIPEPGVPLLLATAVLGLALLGRGRARP